MIDDSRDGVGDAEHTSMSYSCKTPVPFRYTVTYLPVTVLFSVTLCVPDARACAMDRKWVGTNESQDSNLLPTATINVEDAETKN